MATTSRSISHFVTLNNRYVPAAEAAYIVDDINATALIASAALPDSEELGRLSPRCHVKLSVGGKVSGFEDFDAAIARHPAQPLDDERVETFMLYSSGITGRPKRIKRPLSDAAATEGNQGMLVTAQMWSKDESTIYLSAAPLYYSAPGGFICAAISSAAGSAAN